MEALDGGRLIRFTHAQGGRDGTPYLPTFIAAYLDAQKPPSVGHLHMQALPANRHFIDMFGLKPVIMLRDIPDMLASYWDMLDTDPVARADGLNCPIPDDFVSLSREEKADFMIDVVAPWYMSYFATWKTFHDDAPETVCVLRYDEFQDDPAADALSCAPARGLPDTARQMRSRNRESLERSHELPLQQGRRRPRPRIFLARSPQSPRTHALALQAIGAVEARVDGRSGDARDPTGFLIFAPLFTSPLWGGRRAQRSEHVGWATRNRSRDFDLPTRGR